jgi:hypothetical protein
MTDEQLPIYKQCTGRTEPLTSPAAEGWLVCGREADARPRNGVALQPIRLTGAREKIAKKTYIRAPRYPQAAFDKACAECRRTRHGRRSRPMPATT